MNKQGLESQLLEKILRWRNPRRNRIMIFLTHLGTGGFIWLIIIAVSILGQWDVRIGLNMVLAMSLSFLLCNLILKPLVRRERPSWNRKEYLLIKNPRDFSFPSGHTSSSFAAATTVFFYQQKLGIFLLIIAILIAFSRIYHYVHYPSDVIVGIALGIFCAFLAKEFFDRYWLEWIFFSANFMIK
ncbi:MAG: phosphatase PAP2 family protein [Tissierellia bacterium]|nr:phosphatase PAP2 family protein [Tissierellia bacterium]